MSSYLTNSHMLQLTSKHRALLLSTDSCRTLHGALLSRFTLSVIMKMTGEPMTASCVSHCPMILEDFIFYFFSWEKMLRIAVAVLRMWSHLVIVHIMRDVIPRELSRPYYEKIHIFILTVNSFLIVDHCWSLQGYPFVRQVSPAGFMTGVDGKESALRGSFSLLSVLWCFYIIHSLCLFWLFDK